MSLLTNERDVDALISAFKQALDGNMSAWNEIVREKGAKLVPFCTFDTFAVQFALALHKRVAELERREKASDVRMKLLEERPTGARLREE